MSELISIEAVASKIFFIRSVKVMLDRDLAGLYGVETRVLNQAVRRNIKRFPEDFMFALSRDEIMRISQIVTSSDIKFAKQVHAFTEQGVAMLSGGVSVQIEERNPLKQGLKPKSDQFPGG